ncbi:MAG: hypothetical protein E8D45_09365 [Nitrospira sp.]|nr:MAG: hypothetical protein E8D45_09365 [Nitrospira sp.]
MTPRRLRHIVIVLLAALMTSATLRPLMVGPVATTPSGQWLAWNIFLFIIPLGLGALLLAGARWALMGAVMYGTIGLALDFSTIVQELTRGGDGAVAWVMSLVTGLVNFGVILTAGQGFLRSYRE